MKQMIVQTPFYLWALLGVLVWGGWKSMKTYVISWKPLLPMPAIMFLGSIYSLMTRYGTLSISLWAICITIGVWLGSLTVRGLHLKFDKKRNLIEIGGHWTPMILSLCIFSLRYFLGVVCEVFSDVRDNPHLWMLESLATVVSGMFTGRLIGYWQRSKVSDHFDLDSN